MREDENIKSFIVLRGQEGLYELKSTELRLHETGITDLIEHCPDCEQLLWLVVNFLLHYSQVLVQPPLMALLLLLALESRYFLP